MTRRPATRALHDPTLSGHVRVGAISANQLTCYAVVAGYKRLALIPKKKARAMDHSVGEGPEGVGIVREEVRSYDDIVVRPHGMATNGAGRGSG
jgi:hypothetical protein